MATSSNLLIVGAGLAGASAARTLRTEGFTGDITLLGSETYRPYIRPPLSKSYLSGQDERDAAFVEPVDWYAEHDVQFHPSVDVVGVDRANHLVHADGGRSYRYDRLLLSTGASPRLLPIPGADRRGVHYLRTLDDADALRAELSAGGRRLVVIGFGWIGMEAGATARTLGNDVTILGRADVPLAASIGAELGEVFAAMHREKGVLLRPSVTVAEITGGDGGVTGVRLSTGEIVPADVVLVGIGAVPNTRLAQDCGLEVDDGIVVSAQLRTSDPDVFAAGDVANALHPIAGIRIRNEHWANALNGGELAAKAMLGQDAVFDAIPYLYSDQFDLGMEYAGFSPLMDDADLVYRGDRGSREFIAFWLRDKRVVAGMNINVWDVNDTIQALIRDGKAVDAERLRDPAIPLDQL